MLSDFISGLNKAYPEARLELIKAVRDTPTAAARLETIITHYSDLFGCKSDLDERVKYAQYKIRVSEILEIHPERVDRALEESIRKGGPVADGAVLLVKLLNSSADAAGDVTGIVGHAPHVLDITDVFGLFGLDLLLSWLVKKFIGGKNREKLRKIQHLTERVCVKAQLARSLMLPGKTDVVQDTVERLRACGSSV